MYVVAADVRAVGERLFNKVHTVGRGVNHDVVGAVAQAAVQYGFEILVFGFVFLKRQVVEKKNKPKAPAVDIGHQLCNRGILVLVNLDNFKLVIAEIGNKRLDGGGLAGARVAVKQNVVAALAAHESVGIIPQRLFLPLVPHNRALDFGRKVGNGGKTVFFAALVAQPERVRHTEKSRAARQIFAFKRGKRLFCRGGFVAVFRLFSRLDKSAAQSYDSVCGVGVFLLARAVIGHRAAEYFVRVTFYPVIGGNDFFYVRQRKRAYRFVGKPLFRA